jgi:predicted transposase/invertase (TIGR01784 family)
MPNFILKETALKTRLDKWLFFIKNLEDFQSIPSIFKEEIIFEKAFEKAELAKFSHIEWESYERSLKDFRDAKGIFDYAKETAFDEGKTAGMMEGKIQGNIESKIEIALKAKNMGLKIEDIMVLTGLSRQAIDAL